MTPMTQFAEAAELSDCRAIVTHGSGSDSGFLARAFPARRLGVRSCEYLDDRSGDVGRIVARVAAAVSRVSPDPVVLVGVSLGAHAVGALLSRRPLGVVSAALCLPAWTGAPDSVAAMTGVAARELSTLGIPRTLAGLDPSDWVTKELARSWSGRSHEQLSRELAAAATQWAPDRESLARIAVPVGLVALADDPLHPVSVASTWSRVIPRAALEVVPREMPGVRIDCFAGAALTAMSRAAASGRRATPSPVAGVARGRAPAGSAATPPERGCSRTAAHRPIPADRPD